MIVSNQLLQLRLILAEALTLITHWTIAVHTMQSQLLKDPLA
jgi:hypothetical protein